MKTYEVEVWYNQIEYYVVEAESKEDAIEKVQKSTDLTPDSSCDCLWEVQFANEITINE